jgi:small subunit ribosomal protein S13
MARIAGVNLPNAKRIETGLTYIYGIGPTQAKAILEATKLDPSIRVKDLTEAQEIKLREYIDKNLTVEGDLQRLVAQSISRLREINSYRGTRHKNNLPVHGQRTKTNGRTKRGRKVTMGSGRKKAASKT